MPVGAAPQIVSAAAVLPAVFLVALIGAVVMSRSLSLRLFLGCNSIYILEKPLKPVPNS